MAELPMDSRSFPASSTSLPLAPPRRRRNPPRSDKDRNFALHGRIAGTWKLEGLAESQARLKEDRQVGRQFHRIRTAPREYSSRSSSEQPLRLDIKVATPRDILLERLEHEASESANPHPWIIIPQDHAYSPAELGHALLRSQGS